MKRLHGLRAAAVVAVLLGASLALTACGSGGSTTDTGTSPSQEETQGAGEAAQGTEETAASESGGEGGGSLGLLMDTARNDKSFGQSMYEGAEQAANELDLTLTTVDSVVETPQKAQSALLNFAREDDYVIANAVGIAGALPRIAEQYPDTQFAQIAVPIKSSDNLHWAYQDWYPLGYLAGIAAANTTKSNVIGFVGGAEIPSTVAGLAGFKDAIKAVNPKIKLLSTMTGNFDDPTKGKASAAAQIAQGADVIYSYLDAGHLGAVAAAKEAGGVKVLGVVVPKCDESEGLDIGDSVSSQTALTSEVVREMVAGTIENTVYALENPKVASFKFCPGASTPAVEKDVEKARDEFDSGALTTPPQFTETIGEE